MAAKRLNGAANPVYAARAPMSLAFLTDHRQAHKSDVIIRTLPGGTGVILREYDDPKRRARAHRIAALCRRYGLVFYVGGDLSLAYETKADGLHAPSWMAGRLKQKPRGLMLSVACHEARDLETADNLGADSVFLSPVFATNSHPGKDYLDTNEFLELASKSRVPVLALGGVTLKNAQKLKSRAVVGFGAIDAFSPSGALNAVT